MPHALRGVSAVHMAGSADGLNSLSFRRDSRLLVALGAPRENEQRDCDHARMEWDGVTDAELHAPGRPMPRMIRRVVVMKLIQASAFGVLLSAGAASAADGVRLVAQPDLMPRVAAFPRVAHGEPQAARINQALEAADARGRAAAEECRSEFSGGATAGLSAESSLDPGRILGWERRIVVAMGGPRYLALVTADYADCGGIHPSADSIALTYDLRTGQPPNWLVLLPKTWVQKMTIDRAMDETPRGVVGSVALRSLYHVTAGKAIRAISPNCMESMNQMAGPFMLWPDARQGGLMVQPVGLPHASAACGVPALVGIALLRRQGVQPALLDAIAAHRAAIGQAPGG